MLLPLSILPFTLMLVHSVQSVDLYKNKRVPRRHTEVIRSRNSYQIPTTKDSELIPVSEVHEDKKVIQGDTTSELNIEEHKKYPKVSARSVNRPPSVVENYESDTPTIVNDYEEELMKPRMRSLKFEKQARSVLTSSNTSTDTQRRRSQVRKVKVNKTQLQDYVNKSQSSANITEDDEKDLPKLRIVPSQTEEEIKTPFGPYTSKRRNGLRKPFVPIVESENYVFAHSGDFHYSYEGGDGTKAYERGELKSTKDGAGSAVEGSFSYKDKDGNDYSLSYTADENGYRPIGAHLPTPPPIPIAIQRALALLATKTTPEPITERISLL